MTSATRTAAPALPEWIAAMLPEGGARYRVRVDPRGEGPIHVHVMEFGEGQPVLMVHGNPTWGFLYRRIAAALVGSGLRLVIPDLPGLGLSDKPRDPAFHTLDRHADILAAVLEHVGVERPIFVGQDWGGPVGLLALERAPAVGCGGMVLLNTVIGPPKPGFRPTAFHKFARAPGLSQLVFRGLGFPQIGLHLAQGDRGSIRGQVARAYRWPLLRFGDRVAPLALARMVPDSLSHPSIPALQRCQAFVEAFDGPAELVWGERDPVLGRLCSRVARALPQAEVLRTRAGHFLQEEVPEPIAAAIRRVARAIEAA